ncbi:GyrI-like domain-containing protein [Clostridium sp.]|uniref:GyrI-like domain-containing protein n=1 Tax=Clostridium sp. TaxID=1506 RepID=UPI002FCB527F
MEKLDYKKAYKELYLPKRTPNVVTVPKINFVVIEGQGDPNGEEFIFATAALYNFSYTVKMSYKSDNIPEGYYNYTVFPLEGEWDLIDKTIASTVKSNYKYKLMIRQPDFLTLDLFQSFLLMTKKKKGNTYLDKLYFETIEDGLCCQMLHIGSYDEEPESFRLMDKFCEENEYERISKIHKEIYLSDPRKTEVSKLNTVLRYKIEKKCH